MIKKVELQFNDLGIAETIQKFAKLFESTEKDGILPCYLTYCPPLMGIQGGANGEGIYTQVSTEMEIGSLVKQVISVITHEYMHKSLNPGQYFQNHPNKFKRKIYNSKQYKVYPDKYYQFIEEVLVYSLSDVITFGVNPEVKLNNYKARHSESTDQRNHFVALWEAIIGVKEMLKNFNLDKVNKEDTIAHLDDYFLGLINLL